MATPFDVLDVSRDASEAEIERAYRRRVKEAHPDHGGSAEEFRRVREAYEELLADDANALREAVERDAGQARASPDSTGRQRYPNGDPVQHTETRVEYLNYEVLDDHRWSLADGNLFEKAAEADLDPADYGHFEVDPAEYLLEAAEGCGYAWPFACRGGACANCAVAVLEGELAQPVDHILPQEMLDRDIRLSCMGTPLTEEVRVVYNVKHLPELDDLRLPPHPFEHAHAGD